ncbi:MAG: hypothetical protein JO359_07105 [Candidatus Eremiobacteraeota bacterium]|nr:hypothetical protein [Candidatus Eremiobacteraeota bacterium]
MAVFDIQMRFLDGAGAPRDGDKLVRGGVVKRERPSRVERVAVAWLEPNPGRK